jgi:hypothetical protein
MSALPSFPLPAVGDMNGQLNQAQSMLNTLSTAANGDPSSIAAMANAGVTLFSHLGPNAKLVSQLVGLGAGIASGFAVGGPFGAAAGAVSGLVGILGSLFQGYQGVEPVAPTVGEQRLYQLQAAWYANVATNNGLEFGNPQGWTLYDYLAHASTPSGTPRPAALYALVQESLPYVGSASAAAELVIGVSLGEELSSPAGFASVYPTDQAYVQLGGRSPDGKGAHYLDPLCTPVFWDWGQASKIQDCVLNEWFGSSPHTAKVLYGLAENDIYEAHGWNKARIMKSAVDRAPDLLYFDANLYAFQFGNATVYFNFALLIAVSTVLGMLQVGASTMAIVRELEFQQKVLHDSDGAVAPGVQLLLNDYLALAHAEEAAKKSPLGGKPKMKHHLPKPKVTASGFAKGKGGAIAYHPSSSALPWVLGGGAAAAGGAWWLLS